MNSAQSMIQRGQLVIQGWWQCAQSWYQQLGQLFRSVILPKSADPARRAAEKMVDEEEIVEETQVEEGEGDEIQDGEVGALLEEIEEESCEGEVEETSEEETEEETWEGEGRETSEEEIQEDDEEGKEGAPTSLSILGYSARSEEEIEDEEEGETSEEEIEKESCEGEVGETSEQEREEDNEEGKEGESTSLLLLWYCARSMLTWFATVRFCRDWSYGIFGIKSDKKDTSAVESLVPITERISLKNRIKRIEEILDTSEKSDLLNDKNSSSGTTKDTDKESSSSTVKNSANESSSKQKEIDELSRDSAQKVFGREKDRADISRMLREAPDTYAASSSTSKPYSVIGIYGITGSGKSTLAQYVCDHEKYAGHFNPVMFIHVGETFSVGDVFRDMMEQTTQSRPPNNEGPKSLKTKLKETLKDKRFFLVLDDLWVNDDNQKELDILLDMLTLSAARSGSRVLVTAQKGLLDMLTLSAARSWSSWCSSAALSNA
ncbi:uncharacterized protein [Miscanthus floridulus]|uniref:uncharacterized protein isoform X2 n=1 Tax=Miscanthus floridulus TaxID=154761 RepID=UPI003457E587